MKNSFNVFGKNAAPLIQVCAQMGARAEIVDTVEYVTNPLREQYYDVKLRIHVATEKDRETIDQVFEQLPDFVHAVPRRGRI